jgi:hypothetical protein
MKIINRKLREMLSHRKYIDIVESDIAIVIQSQKLSALGQLVRKI